jgi:hypothetical protein
MSNLEVDIEAHRANEGLSKSIGIGKEIWLARFICCDASARRSLRTAAA